MESVPDDISEGHAVDINSCCAPWIVVTELRRCRAAKRVPGDTHFLHIDPAFESSSWVIGVQFLQSIEREFQICNPYIHEFRGKILCRG